MLKLLTRSIALVAAVAMLSGCANGLWTSGDTGAVLGGVAGGALGHQIGGGFGKTLATVAGGTAGSILGRRVGQRMTRNDRSRFSNTLASNRAGQTRRWASNAGNGHYQVTPVGSNYRRDKRTCREFRMQVQVEGRPEHINGTACRQPDGSWLMQ